MIYERYRLSRGIEWNKPHLADPCARCSFTVSDAAVQFIDRMVETGSSSPVSTEEHRIAHELNQYGLLNPSMADYRWICGLPLSSIATILLERLAAQVRRDIGHGIAPARRTSAGLGGIVIASLRANRPIIIIGALFTVFVLGVTAETEVQRNEAMYTASTIPVLVSSLLLSVIVHEYSHYLAIVAVRGRPICTMQIGPKIRIVHFPLSGSRRRLVGLSGPIAGASFATACVLLSTAFQIDLLSTIWLVLLGLYHILFLLPSAADGRMLFGKSGRGEWPE